MSTSLDDAGASNSSPLPGADGPRRRGVAVAPCRHSARLSPIVSAMRREVAARARGRRARATPAAARRRPAPDEPGLPSGSPSASPGARPSPTSSTRAISGAAQQADVLEDAVEQAIVEGTSRIRSRRSSTAAAKKLQNDVNCPQAALRPRKRSTARSSREKQSLEAQKEEAEGDEAKGSTSRSRAPTDSPRSGKDNGKGNEATARETNERPDARRRPLTRRADARAGRHGGRLPRRTTSEPDRRLRDQGPRRASVERRGVPSAIRPHGAHGGGARTQTSSTSTTRATRTVDLHRDGAVDGYMLGEELKRTGALPPAHRRSRAADLRRARACARLRARPPGHQARQPAP